MVYEKTETCSQTGMLMIVYVVVFWRNKSVDFMLIIQSQLPVYDKKHF